MIRDTTKSRNGGGATSLDVRAAAIAVTRLPSRPPQPTRWALRRRGASSSLEPLVWGRRRWSCGCSKPSGLHVAHQHLNIRAFYTREARESGERVGSRLSPPPRFPGQPRVC